MGCIYFFIIHKSSRSVFAVVKEVEREDQWSVVAEWSSSRLMKVKGEV